MGSLVQCRFRRSCRRTINEWPVSIGTYFHWGTGLVEAYFEQKSGLSRI